MFQTYDPPEPRQKTGAERVEELRQLLVKAGLDALLVPRADEHQGEYVSASAERLKWLTGFSGSAGLAAIARNAAALFVDGRYVVQAPAQVDRHIFEVLQAPEAKLEDWLGKHLKAGDAVGFDPRLHTQAMLEDLTKGLRGRGIELVAIRGENLVDQVWGAVRPDPPVGPIVVHPMRYAGKSAEQKIGELQASLRKEGEDAVVLTLPDSIAWLFNIRGSDVAHNPVPLAYALVPASGKPELFVDRGKIGAEAGAHLAKVAKIVPDAKRAKPGARRDIAVRQSLEARLRALRAAPKRIRLDPATASSWFFRRLKGGKATIVRGTDPCLLPKARKNAIEIKGARAAHKRDGAAVVRFLAWLDREAPAGALDEITASRRLEEMRGETQALKEISFDTISGAGPNGAIVHYRVTTATNRKLRSGELYLVDSGAQYLDGTTDITRTVAIGEPTREMCERFTLVLKGHIAVATARFPRGTRGVDLDPFARRALWEAGLDFDHGTGHGIGSYLSVHEGPQSISRRGMTVLEPGMIISNEPGYYKAGSYGIRIENLLLVTEPAKVAGGEREVMGFETLTLAPIDRHLVLRQLLSAPELCWLDAYHARVREIVGPELGPADRAWLEAATAPIGA
ncbi:MAG TPA: aminopeptidase P family protein [Hyphomicrobiaceae bacterium]|nr:aminopeptidase P family protein [Hyphomicrobiaceae bacterium]